MSRASRFRVSARAVLLFFVVALGFSFGAEEAYAQSTYPIRAQDRPATLPKHAVRVDVVALGSRTAEDPVAATVVVGGGWGMTQNLEVGAQVLPIDLSPAVQYSSPSVYATLNISLNETASIEPTIQSVFPVHGSDPFFIDAGAALDMDLGEATNITAQLVFSLNTRQGGDGTSLSLPVTFAVQARDRISWQISSGIGFSRFDPRFGFSRRSDPLDFNEITIPASVQVAYALSSKRSRNVFIDIIALLQFPQLYTRANTRGWHVEDWSLQLQISRFVVN